MKRLIAAMTLALVTIHAAAVQSAELDAKGAVTRAWQLYQSNVQTEQELIEVRVNQAGRALPTKLLWRRIRFGDQGQRVSVKFVEPVADLGLALLIERNVSARDQIWLRLPSWTGPRKVAGNRETRYFADTAFTFEDNKQLIGEQTALFDYRYVSRSAAGAVISASPRAGVVSGYGRREITLNAQGVPQRIVYFDDQPQPLKTLTFEEINQTAQGRWRSDRIVVRQRDGGQTVLTVRKRVLNAPLSERVFSQASMTETDSARRD